MEKKKVFLLVVAIFLVAICSSAIAEGVSDEWACPSCNNISTGNFCSNCGEKKPIQDNTNEWVCSSCGAKVTGNFCSVCGSKRPETKTADNESFVSTESDISVINVNGDILLELNIDFEKNLLFSTYNVAMYLDDIYIATLPHGQSFHGVVSVSKGIHVISFYEENDTSVKGTSQFNIESKTTFYCEIHAKSSKIKVDNEKIGNASNNAKSISREDYIASCKTLDYNNIERYPDKNKGIKTKVTGKVIQVSEGWFDTVIMRVKEENGNIWYITYSRSNGEARILEDDTITIYGECDGVETYTTILGGSVTIPSINAKYIVMK